MSANLNALVLLRQIPVFQSLSPDQLQAVAAQCQLLHFQPGSLVFAQGQAKQGAMIFASGRAVLTQTDSSGNETVVGQIRAGQIAGENGLYNEGVEPANVRVVEPADVLFLSRKRYNQLATQLPEFRSSIRVNSQQTVPLQPQPGYGIPNYNPALPIQQGFNNTPAADNQPDVLDTGVPGEAQAAVDDGKPKYMPDKRPDEVLLYVFHPHWWALVRLIWIPILTIGAALVIGLLLSNFSGWLGLTVFGIGAIVTGLAVVYGYTAWRDDALYVTDQRVLRVRNLIVTFQRRVSEIPLGRITGVTWSIPNLDVMARVFNYGSVVVQSSSETSNVNVDFIVRPENVNQTIFSLRDRYMNKNSAENEEAIRAEVVRALGLDGGEANPQAAIPQKRENDVYFPPQGPFFARTRMMSKDGEVVYRRHWSVWLSHVALPSLIIGIVLVIGTVVVGAGGHVDLPILSLGVLIGLVVGGIWFYLSDWDWRNDLLILGDETITLIHRRPMWLQNQVNRVRIIQIDNVVSDVHGLVNTLLDRGNIRISLVGSDQNLHFTKVAGPNSIQMEISRRLGVIKREAEQGAVDRQEEATLRYLQAFYQLTQGGQQTVAMPPVAFAPQTTQPAQPAQQTTPNAPAGVTFTPGTAPRWSGTPTQPVPPAQPTQPNQPPPPPPNGDNRPPRVPR